MVERPSREWGAAVLIRHLVDQVLERVPEWIIFRGVGRDKVKARDRVSSRERASAKGLELTQSEA